MKQSRVVLSLPLLLAALCWPCVAWAQHPTAVQKLELSAFGGATGVFTGLDHGKNLGITAGADLALVPLHGFRPTIEVRGTYPIHKGGIDSQESVMGGLRVNFLLDHRIHPYGDFLFGRGQMNYGQSGFFFNDYVYELTTTYVYSPGAGFDYDLDEHFAIKVDGQYQRWSSTPTTSGTVYSKVGTIGLVYRFNFNGHGRR